MPEYELQEFIEGDLRATITNRKRKMDTSEELAATREALAKVTREIDDLRGELSKIRGETARSTSFAFGFNLAEFKSMNFTRGLTWVNEVLAEKIRSEIAKHKDVSSVYQLLRSEAFPEVNPCARFNRGEPCQVVWHTHSKPNKKGGQGQKKELRLHCCAVCTAVFGSLANHGLSDCPWMKQDTWSRMKNDQDEQVVDQEK